MLNVGQGLFISGGNFKFLSVLFGNDPLREYVSLWQYELKFARPLLYKKKFRALTTSINK